MTNDNKLFESIINSGKEQAQLIIDEAEEKAAGILEEAEKKADAEAEAVSANADAKAENMKNAALSSASLIERNAVLEAKRGEINKTLDLLIEHINSLEADKYFAFIYRLAEGIDGDRGTVILNKRDRERLPKDFAEKMKAAGIDAEISDTTADITGGFILKCGDIESNCSLNAVIEDRKNELEDYINRYLFAEEN